ncbi:MAG: pyridoxal phosphate-dependent aminotransferase, partial [Pseudomonadota bacterium]
MAAPRFTALVRSLPATVPFVGPEAQERARGKAFKARIGANENAFGASPLATDAMARAARGAWMYADPENHDLREALAAHHGIAPANIVVGEGIDGLLGYIARMTIAPGVAVVTSHGAYPTFNYHVAGFGGALTFVPYRDDHEDLEALAATAHEHDASLVYLANPDNPMGTWHNAAAIERFIDALPASALLCLDEAYVDLAPHDTAPPLRTDDPRVIRLRTFSKAHGLAGLRIGYAIAEASVAASFNKVRNHFGVNRIAQAGALASLNDSAHLAKLRGLNAEACRQINTIARANGLIPLASAANFVAIDCGRDGAFARAVLEGLIARDVFVRMPFVAPLDRCIRVTAAPAADLAVFAQALPAAL